MIPDLRKRKRLRLECHDVRERWHVAGLFGLQKRQFNGSLRLCSSGGLCRDHACVGRVDAYTH